MKDAITLATMSFITAEIILIIFAINALKIIKQISDWQSTKNKYKATG